MAKLKLEKIVKRYPTATVVNGVDIEVDDGEMVALLGPSGCGKTTTLRMVAGFVAPSEGRILIGGKDVTLSPAHQRNTGMVFQSYALFPHMTVAANVGFGLEMRKVSASERQTQVRKALELVQLGHLGDRYPRQLSGGQQQRVALARALVINPAVFLLDEPLSNLDAKLRGQVRTEIRQLQQRLGLTTLLVTHDQEEALTMADKLIVMEGGMVQQIGTPEDLYERPRNAFVAGFVGRCNLIEGQVVARGSFRSSCGQVFECSQEIASLKKSFFALRPERLKVAPRGLGSGGIDAVISAVSYLGAHTEYRIRSGETEFISMQETPSLTDPLHGAHAGTEVRIYWDPASARVVSA